MAPPTMTRVRSEIALKLEERIKLGKEMLGRERSLNELTYEERLWRDYNYDFLRSVFSSPSIATSYHHSVPGYYTTGDAKIDRQNIKNAIREQLASLISIFGRLDLFDESMPRGEDEERKKSAAKDGTKVFVVHGHDEAILQAVARFLEKIGLFPIVLREQPDQGRTIIEKFEIHAREVGFAIVLLTPDDVAGAASGDQAMRARQNVIFELGYFVGSLGRGRACLLRKGNVEIPSDLHGVIYTDFDGAEGWKRKLARELKAAEFQFDDAKVYE